MSELFDRRTMIPLALATGTKLLLAAYICGYFMLGSHGTAASPPPDIARVPGLLIPLRFESLELALARSFQQRGHTAAEESDDADCNGDRRMVLSENFGLRHSA